MTFTDDEISNFDEGEFIEGIPVMVDEPDTTGSDFESPDEFNGWRKGIPRKGRQGRNRETRERIEASRHAYRLLALQKGWKVGYQEDICPETHCASVLIQDLRNGNTVCQSCGRVVVEGGLDAQTFTALHLIRSKPYQRKVHFRTRLSQLMGRDPLLPKHFLRDLHEYVFNNHRALESKYGSSRRWGQQILKDIFRSGEVTLPSDYTPSRLAIHWIQVRKWCYLYPHSVDLDMETERELVWRYDCVSTAFDATLPDSTQPRKNIYNINYIMAQLLRLVSPFLFAEYARFIPLVKRSIIRGEGPVRWKRNYNQTLRNNVRWKSIVEYCAAHYPRTVHFGCVLMDWSYHPITLDELQTTFDKFI